MYPDPFNDFIAKLRNAYGQQMYAKKRDEEYGQVVRFLQEQVGKDIPPAAADWMFEKILDAHDRFPDKLHRVLKHWLWRYYEAFPEKMPPGMATAGMCKNENCQDGFLRWYKLSEKEKSPIDPDRGRYMESSCPCGDCRRLGRRAENVMTFEQGTRKGLIARSLESALIYRQELEEMGKDFVICRGYRIAPEYVPRNSRLGKSAEMEAVGELVCDLVPESVA